MQFARSMSKLTINFITIFYASVFANLCFVKFQFSYLLKGLHKYQMEGIFGFEKVEKIKKILKSVNFITKI